MRTYRVVTCELRDKEVDVEIQSWHPAVPAVLSGSSENWSPAEGGYGDWVVLDDNGREDKALMKELTPDEIEMIEQVCFTEMEQ